MICIERTACSATEGVVELRISGCVTVQQASRLKDEITAALGVADEVRVNLAAVTDIDFTGLLLFCSAHRAAKGQGKRLVVDGAGNAPFAEALAKAGYVRQVSCVKEAAEFCIWSRY